MINNHVKIVELFFSFLKLGFTAFGGPAMVAYIKELVVEKREWLDKQTFQDGVVLAQVIPGATAIQMAGYVGFKTRGILGGLASFTGFGLPAFLFMLFLSQVYVKTHDLPKVISVFTGLQVVVVSIVANAFLSFARPLVNSKAEMFMAILSFLLLFFKVSPFLIIFICLVLSQLVFKDVSINKTETSKRINYQGLLILIFIPFIELFFLYFWDKTLFNISLVMIKIDLFAFGGGYASLPLMMHEFVDRLGWIDNRTFMDGIALGQVTPGPIVITATFVGYLLKGLLGALMATISVFTPSFIIMALFCEFSDKMNQLKIFLKAKQGILASFSALLLFVLIKFIVSLDWNFLKAMMAMVSFFALYRKVNLVYVVLISVLFSAFLF
ncbi:MAG: Chromate transporter, chromate ion transporter (CHR) family [Thermodesulfobacterium sp. 37_54]|uniref:Transporter n=2 Tax=Thermodesulfobacterium commune TaxID=1741 RepID=A0A075WS68_9BACT|nr:chromate efflux transporter [Thermodesulfobacterium commune]KUJ97725.1 MAG: Chromate transporter, chromate ion transporter (CHR) family [Thermodesulfobacterium sp. 37_54]AIH03701.1 transporter [Thermodesulfobacterium commune DSM 2178]KUK37853.1 MAG: Chromate transporter, chromate ion transporter (CHR) family [Thermodesulfobacterium commune]HAA83791.1 transporter [Thermodesulfobacterium commune]HBT03621.1 transporter [Thermodesulfobacterium commune]